MPEFSYNNSLQIRPPSGEAFWSFPTDAFEGSKIEVDIHTKVPWDGREWIYKEKERTLNEIVAYQIAATIGLPLQPWLAFVRPGQQPSEAGMLIEWWTTDHSRKRPGPQHSALIARELALWTFNGDELPVWLVSEDEAEIRLIDLEGIGPYLSWPLHRIHLENYRRVTRQVFCERQKEAKAAGITTAFDEEALHLAALNLSRVIDLSGHANAPAFTKRVFSALHARQLELGKLLRVT